MSSNHWAKSAVGFVPPTHDHGFQKPSLCRPSYKNTQSPDPTQLAPEAISLKGEEVISLSLGDSNMNPHYGDWIWKALHAADNGYREKKERHLLELVGKFP